MESSQDFLEVTVMAMIENVHFHAMCWMTNLVSSCLTQTFAS